MSRYKSEVYVCYSKRERESVCVCTEKEEKGFEF